MQNSTSWSEVSAASLEKCRGLAHQDLRAPVLGETEDAGADGGHRDAGEALFRPQASSTLVMALPELVVLVPFAHPRPDGMDDMPGTSFPPEVMAAPPTGTKPIASLSSWMIWPPFRTMAPATPPPCWSRLFAAFTMASTSRSVRSADTSRRTVPPIVLSIGSLSMSARSPNRL